MVFPSPPICIKVSQVNNYFFINPLKPKKERRESGEIAIVNTFNGGGGA
jgi:hypothetical protein